MRGRIVIFVTPAILALGLLLYGWYSGLDVWSGLSKFLIPLAFALLAVSVASLLMLYLDSGAAKISAETARHDAMLNTLDEELSELKQNLGESGKKLLP